MSKIAKLRSSLSNALEKIGTTNGHAYTGTSNTAALLHEYWVATEGEGYFKKRRDAALKSLKESGIIEKEPPAGSESIVVTSDYFDLSLKKSNPQQRIDKALFAKALIKLFRATPDKIEAFSEEVTKEGEPSRTYRAIPKDV